MDDARNPLAPTPPPAAPGPGAGGAAPGPASAPGMPGPAPAAGRAGSPAPAAGPGTGVGRWRAASLVAALLLLVAGAWYAVGLVILPRLLSEVLGTDTTGAVLRSSTLTVLLASAPWIVVVAGAVIALSGLASRAPGGAARVALLALAALPLCLTAVIPLLTGILGLFSAQLRPSIAALVPVAAALVLVLVLVLVLASAAVLAGRGPGPAAVRPPRPAAVAVTVLAVCLLLAALWARLIYLPPIAEPLMGSDGDQIVARSQLLVAAAGIPSQLVWGGLVVATATLLARSSGAGRRPAWAAVLVLALAPLGSTVLAQLISVSMSGGDLHLFSIGTAISTGVTILCLLVEAVVLIILAWAAARRSSR